MRLGFRRRGLGSVLLGLLVGSVMLTLLVGSSAAWAAGQATVVWSTATDGAVDSSPAVVDGYLYVGSDDGWIYKLNATTGQIVYKTHTGGAVDSSPAVVGGYIYVGSDDGKIYKLVDATGQIVYTTQTGGAVDSSPAVVGGYIYVGSDDHVVYALDAITGTPVWSYTTGGPVSSSPAVVGGIVYVGSGDFSIWALKAAFNWSGFFPPVASLPTFNQVKAGQGVPFKFSLGGNQGLSIFAAGSPTSQSIACPANAPRVNIGPVGTGGLNSLSYNSKTDTYTYVWKTDKSWAGTCRQFVMTLVDGTQHAANFEFK